MRKIGKAKKRLALRQKDYDDMVKKGSGKDYSGYKRPGSIKK